MVSRNERLTTKDRVEFDPLQAQCITLFTYFIFRNCLTNLIILYVCTVDDLHLILWAKFYHRVNFLFQMFVVARVTFTKRHWIYTLNVPHFMVQSNLLQSVFKPIPCVSVGLWLRESIKHINIHQLPLTALLTKWSSTITIMKQILDAACQLFWLPPCAEKDTRLHISPAWPRRKARRLDNTGDGSSPWRSRPPI